ncbi:uncharacterized protein LOC34619653 [Cyclospora cayetanensis]|uniref:Uncharacterized protein LOC34619653 n=1 Tax=Cyclospora cayetanensis TaxID=88456 RepID=A0A6P6RW33_9EIME|nr:uncharacterized protein LOC34619653 [Cyclospora cayetanensis]
MPQKDAFLVAYYDESAVWPSLSPSIESRLPLDVLPLRGVGAPSQGPPGGGGPSYPSSPGTPVMVSFVSHSLDPSPPANASVPGPPAAFTAAQKAAAGALASLGVSVAAASLTAGGTAIPAASTTAAALSSLSPRLVWTVTERPFAHLLLLQYESIEVYRQQQRRVLRAWVERQLEQHDEWLVLVAAPCSSQETAVKQLKKYLEKMRTDLNTKDRILRVPCEPVDPSQAPVAEQLWTLFLQRLKDALASAVEYRMMLAEDFVQRMQQQQQDASSILAARETLAALYAKCGRYAEALRVLDAWEVSSLPALTRSPAAEQQTGDFLAVGGSDGLPLLACESRAAELFPKLRSGSLGPLHCWELLFCKQAVYLIQLNKLEELGSRGLSLFSGILKVAASVACSSDTKIHLMCWAVLGALNLANFLTAKLGTGASSAVVMATAAGVSAESGESESRGSGVSQVFASSLPLLRRPTSAVARTLTRLAPSHLTFLPSRRQHGDARSSSSKPKKLQHADTASLPQQQVQQQQQQQVHRAHFRGGGEGQERLEGDVHGFASRRSYSQGADKRVDSSTGGGGVVFDSFASDTASGQAKSAASLYAFVAQQLLRLAALKKKPAEWQDVFALLPVSASRQPGPFSSCDSLDMNEETSNPEAQQQLQSRCSSFSASAAASHAETATLFFPPDAVEELKEALEICSAADLRRALSAPDKLQVLYLRVLLLGGQHYVNCGFFRHAALLQHRIAAMHLQAGDFRECQLAIQRMMPLFLKEPWTDKLLARAEALQGDRAGQLASLYVLSNAATESKGQHQLQQHPAACQQEGGQSTLAHDQAERESVPWSGLLQEDMGFPSAFLLNSVSVHLKAAPNLFAWVAAVPHVRDACDSSPLGRGASSRLHLGVSPRETTAPGSRQFYRAGSSLTPGSRLSGPSFFAGASYGQLFARGSSSRGWRQRRDTSHRGVSALASGDFLESHHAFSIAAREGLLSLRQRHDSMAQDLLEHAILRQLADLLPLYVLHASPAVEMHPTLRFYEATLARLKPKTIAGVLGQRLRRHAGSASMSFVSALPAAGSATEPVAVQDAGDAAAAGVAESPLGEDASKDMSDADTSVKDTSESEQEESQARETRDMDLLSSQHACNASPVQSSVGSASARRASGVEMGMLASKSSEAFDQQQQQQQEQEHGHQQQRHQQQQQQQQQEGEERRQQQPQQQQELRLPGSEDEAASLHLPSPSRRLRSRAVSLMQTCSARGCIPSLSVALGETIEIQVYVHSALLLPLHLDAVALRLAAVPSGAPQGLPLASLAAAAATTSCEFSSGWLVVNSATLQQQQQLVIRPGVSVLRLLWCCCKPGVYLVEQICFRVKDVVLTQWAGDLPPPALLPNVTAAMEAALVGCAPLVALAATRSHATSEAGAADAHASADAASCGVASSSSSGSSSTTTTTAPIQQSACEAAQGSLNPYYLREDAGDELSAAAFAERLYGDPRMFAISSCSPAGATLLHPCAALERLLHPLMLEYRHPSSCIAVQVDSLLPQQHHQLLQCLQQGQLPPREMLQGGANVLLEGVESSLLVTITVPPGFLKEGGARLRVLQALSVATPSSCTSSVMGEDLEDASVNSRKSPPSDFFEEETRWEGPYKGASRGRVAFDCMRHHSRRESEASAFTGVSPVSSTARRQTFEEMADSAARLNRQIPATQATTCNTFEAAPSLSRLLPQLLIGWKEALCVSVDGEPACFPLLQRELSDTSNAGGAGSSSTAAAENSSSPKSLKFGELFEQEVMVDSEGAEVVVAVPHDSTCSVEEAGWIPLPLFSGCVQLLLPVSAICSGAAGEGLRVAQQFLPDSSRSDVHRTWRGETSCTSANSTAERSLDAHKVHWPSKEASYASEAFRAPHSDSIPSTGASRCSNSSLSESISRRRTAKRFDSVGPGHGVAVVASALAFTCTPRPLTSANVSSPVAASAGAAASHERFFDVGVFPASVELDASPFSRGDTTEEASPAAPQRANGLSSVGNPVMHVLRLHSVEVRAALTHALSFARLSDGLRIVQVFLKAASTADKLLLRSAEIIPKLQRQHQQPLPLSLSSAASTLHSAVQEEEHSNTPNEGPVVSLVAPPHPSCRDTHSQIADAVILGTTLFAGTVQTLLVKAQYSLPASTSSSCCCSPSSVHYDLVVRYEIDDGGLEDASAEAALDGLFISDRRIEKLSSTSTSIKNSRKRTPLTYVIPIELPARVSPLMVNVEAPRTGREAVEVCHWVCLEFDRQEPPEAPGGGSRGVLEQQRRHQRSSGGAQTHSKSPRIGECHDWLMAGSKCKARVIEGGKSATVAFSAIPLRAGSLRLPAVRLLCRKVTKFPIEGRLHLAGFRAARGAPSFVSLWGGVLDRKEAEQPSGDDTWIAAEASSSEPPPWAPVFEGKSLTAGREVLVLPKLVSTPDVRLLQD